MLFLQEKHFAHEERVHLFACQLLRCQTTMTSVIADFGGFTKNPDSSTQDPRVVPMRLMPRGGSSCAISDHGTVHFCTFVLVKQVN